MVCMQALAMKELLIGVKCYMNESDKKCYSRYVWSFLAVTTRLIYFHEPKASKNIA